MAKTRKASRKTASRKTAQRKMDGGKRRKTRKLSPALAAWNKSVMEVYREMKKRNPATKLGDAMREAKKRKDRK
jgi:hypothetical protein